MAFFLRVTVIVMAVIGLTSAGCPPMWTRFGDNCYRFMGRELSWTDAENNCQQFFTISGSQGHLASVHSSDEDAFLIQYLGSSVASTEADARVWIGLSDQSIEGTFSWSDGTAMDHEGWIDGQPSNNLGNEDCGEFRFMDSSVKGWNDHRCSDVRAYVCKMPTVRGCF